MIKKTLIIISLMLIITAISSCTAALEEVENVDPIIPAGTYIVKYFERCNEDAECFVKLGPKYAVDFDDYFKTFWDKKDYLWLAYNYYMGELYRKYVYNYNKLGLMTRSEYRDSDDELLSYIIYEYDEYRNLIRVAKYLKGDKLEKETKYIYEDFDRIKIIDVKDYSEKEFVRRKYVVIEYDVEGNIVNETDYDTYYLIFKPPIGDLTRDFLIRYFLKNPDIIDYKMVQDKTEYTGYTILHLRTHPTKIVEKLLFSLNFVGEISDVYKVNYSKDNIITFLISD